jgi:hypothetical protein
VNREEDANRSGSEAQFDLRDRAGKGDHLGVEHPRPERSGATPDSQSDTRSTRHDEATLRVMRRWLSLKNASYTVSITFSTLRFFGIDDLIVEHVINFFGSF